jgi:3-dehydroquinate synthase
MELAKEHNVFIGKEVFEFFEKYFLDARNYSDCVILTDVNVAEKCLPLLYENVPVTENVPVIVLPDGEENKNIQTCIHIWNTWLEHEYDRNVLVVVLGGGMVCDLGAFCASVYKRGVDYVLFPTTLMAQCDAAIGGKNGVNFKHYKNQLGTYQLPEAVFIYPEFLRTLSKRQMINGFAEMIKHALIQDPGYWHFLQTMPLGEFEKLQQAILFSVKIKQKIVSGDFLDRGMRQALNFGHTVGHAIETLAIEKKADI